MNKVILIGNLGSDPELRVSTNGNAVLKLRLATTERWSDQHGEKQEKTEWHRVTLFGKRGEALSKFLTKGQRVAIDGKISYSSYEKEGVKHYSTDIIANDLELLTPKGTGGPKTADESEVPETWKDE
jgi:single-strand DNA-binding protein